MKDIIIAAGYATRLYPLTEHFPKSLLQVGDSTILDRLIRDLDSIDDIAEHIIVSNHKFASLFRAWIEQQPTRKPIRLLDDGTETNETRLGAVRDLLLAIDEYKIDEDILVAAADNILDFSLGDFVRFFKERGTSVVMCYHEPQQQRIRRMGVVVVDEDMRVVDMQEKPQKPASQWATPPFYIYKKSDLPLIRDSLNHGCAADAPGNLAHYLCTVTTLHAYPIRGHRYDIGSLDSYEEAQALFAHK